ncbi:aspartate aminotransferase family protein [Iamia sp. SCSIO 61187]|uniref:aspartate aminotransferase family protein n=1 Tax=Iamia sp. SCSIO 61187 TaxID=2722752 RepID=UPI001C630018|nr:aspartate aminotransferase family protein [Iamia sp. SCSIO 61187]QYG95669.1 aspartate aminotransferase family protein [Iamia sp. SCSIO 61187]
MTPAELDAAAADHLWLHFSRLAGEGGQGPTIIERGQGAHVWDSEGTRYLDGLAGLFVVQAGHGREEIARAAAAQAETLAYFPLWTYAHPTGIELAARLAGMAPGDLNRVFLTTGGAEAVDTAWKLARQYFLAIGQTERVKVIARNLAYHGATLSTLNITGLDAIKEPFLPMLNGLSRHVGITNSQSCPTCDPEGMGPCTAACAEEIERMIVAEGPETVAAVFLEPVQNAGGCFVPGDGYFQRVREICDTHGVLLVSDEVICAFGRLGDWFGSARLGYQPDMLTFAKGVTSGYAPLGGVLVSDRIAEPFLEPTSSFLHGITFGGHPVSCAVALANLDVMEREDLPGRARELEDEFRTQLDTLLDLPIVREVRGMGYFYGIEMTKGGTAFTDDESEWLLRGFLSNRLLENGLICRADDRGDPVIQLAPPLVSGPEEFEAIAGIIRQTLLEAWKELEER